MPQAPGQWFKVDFGKALAFSQITLDAGSSSGEYPRAFEVRVSNDGTNFGPDIARGSGSSQLIAITFSTVTARYVKIISQGTASNCWSIHELKVNVLNDASFACLKPPTGTPVHSLPPSPGIMTSSIAGDGSGNPTTTSSLPGPTTFVLPTQYPVAGGVIGNGTVTFGFTTPAGNQVTCTYKGGSTTAAPTDANELNLGRQLKFVSCSDGLSAGTKRTATKTTMTVTPSPGYPVTVSSPIQAAGGCHESLEILSAAQTHQMRTSFSWPARSTSPRPKTTFRRCSTRGFMSATRTKRSPSTSYTSTS